MFEILACLWSAGIIFLLGFFLGGMTMMWNCERMRTRRTDKQNSIHINKMRREMD